MRRKTILLLSDSLTVVGAWYDEKSTMEQEKKTSLYNVSH
jgi:hypothetical protein